MAEKKCPECPKCLPGWLVQFGDLMSLLLCFFILLLSMATMDKKKVEEYFEIMRRSMGFLEGAEDTAAAERMSLSANHSGSADGGEFDEQESQAEDPATEMQEIAKSFNENSDEEDEIALTPRENNEFSLDIPSSLMFEDGEYQISNPRMKQFIARLARVVRTMPNNMNIEIMGYAGTNIKNDEIPRDSWDISALRSIAVVKELIRNRIEPSTLKISAFGSYRPKSDDVNVNRRVELRFISAKSTNKIVNESNFFDRIKE